MARALIKNVSPTIGVPGTNRIVVFIEYDSGKVESVAVLNTGDELTIGIPEGASLKVNEAPSLTPLKI